MITLKDMLRKISTAFFFQLSYSAFEFFLYNTNLTFLAILYKIDIKGFQNQQK